MYQLGISDVILIVYFVFGKIIPAIFNFLLHKLFGVEINVKSISLLNANLEDVTIQWKNFKIITSKIEFRSKAFDTKYCKLLSILCKNLKVYSTQSKDSDYLKENMMKKSTQEEIHRNELLQDFGFYFNPLLMKAIENVEVKIEDFVFTTLNSDLSQKSIISYPTLKLQLDGFEKRYIRVSSKKELFLVVKSKDQKWNHFRETYFLPEFNFFVDKYKHAEIREDDIIISGFPRSGTTRAQEMVWLLVNDCDFEGAMAHESDVRCPYFDHPGWSFLFRKNTMACSLDEMPSPRCLKTHLPVQLLPDQIWKKKPKIIHISRDIKDVVVSNYHFWYSLDVKRKMDANEYFDLFLNDTILYGPYRESVQDYLNLPDYENIMYITYEGMSADLDGTILNVAKFLGKSISYENRMRLKEHLKFDNMKKSPATNNKNVLTNIQEFTKGVKGDSDNFIRKGIIGDHKNIMSQEYIDRFDKWYAEKDSLNQGYTYSKELEEKIKDL